MGKVIKSVSLGIFVLLLLAGMSSASIMLDRVVAVVNQEVISWSELYREMKSSAPARLNEMGDAEKKQFFKENESQFLENLIDEKLLLQEAKSLNIAVDPAEAREAVENIRKKYSMTEAQLAESLKKEGYTLDEYKRRLMSQIAITRVVNRQIRAKILVSEDDISRFLKENPGAVDTADSYRLSQIIFMMPKSDAGRKALLEKAEAVSARARSGEDFAALAREFSEDPSAAAGGDLGSIKRADLLREFTEVLGSMKPGETSRPFWTDRGLHIIRLEEKAEVRDPGMIREEARHILQNRLFAEKYKAWLKGLREKSFIEIRL